MELDFLTFCESFRPTILIEHLVEELLQNAFFVRRSHD